MGEGADRRNPEGLRAVRLPREALWWVLVIIVQTQGARQLGDPNVQAQ